QPPLSEAFRQSLAPTSAYTRHLSYTAAQANLYNNAPSAPAPQRTERDILLTHHRFLRSPSPTAPDANADYEKALAETYDKKLYKEFVLMSLSRWREGMVAMRWRTEEEVKSGKGERVCAELECGKEKEAETEVLFAYVEDGEKKEAMVKTRLCGGCREKLRKAREREKGGKTSRESSDRNSGRRKRSRSRSERRRKSGDDRSRSPRRRDEERERERERERGPRRYRRRHRSR
ncbi:folate-sensitive fragile site protein Fra10Ac1-domain-containing protein, partial [Sphaerosporella brunnea]